MSTFDVDIEPKKIGFWSFVYQCGYVMLVVVVIHQIL